MNFRMASIPKSGLVLSELICVGSILGFEVGKILVLFVEVTYELVLVLLYATTLLFDEVASLKVFAPDFQ